MDLKLIALTRYTVIKLSSEPPSWIWLWWQKCCDHVFYPSPSTPIMHKINFSFTFITNQTLHYPILVRFFILIEYFWVYFEQSAVSRVYSQIRLATRPVVCIAFAYFISLPNLLKLRQRQLTVIIGIHRKICSLTW